MKKKASFDKEGSSFNKGSFVSQRTPSQKFSRNVTKLFRNIFSAIFPTKSFSSRLVRSRHQSCTVRKGVLRNFVQFTGKHLCQSLFFDKVEGLKPTNVLEKRLWHSCFPVNCAKFLRTPLLTEHLLATASLYCGVTDRAQKIKCNLFSNDREKGNESRKNNPFQTNVPFYFNFSYFFFFFFWRININLNFTSK